MVSIAVKDEKEFQEVEMYLFGLRLNSHVNFSIYVVSTEQVWLYETKYMPQFETWLVVTK